MFFIKVPVVPRSVGLFFSLILKPLKQCYYCLLKISPSLQPLVCFGWSRTIWGCRVRNRPTPWCYQPFHRISSYYWLTACMCMSHVSKTQAFLKTRDKRPEKPSLKVKTSGQFVKPQTSDGILDDRAATMLYIYVLTLPMSRKQEVTIKEDLILGGNSPSYSSPLPNSSMKSFVFVQIPPHYKQLDFSGFHIWSSVRGWFYSIITLIMRGFNPCPLPSLALSLS